MSSSQEKKTMDAITIKNLDVVFGDKSKQALELLDHCLLYTSDAADE